MKRKSYARKINSIEDLKAEKLRLKYEAKRILSFDKPGNTIVNNASSEQSSSTSSSSNTDSILDFFSSAPYSQIIELALSIGLPITKIIGINLEKKVLTKVAKSVLLAYLKWKALELGYKGVHSFIKSRNEANK